MEQLTLRNTRSPQRRTNTRYGGRATQKQKQPYTPRKRNRRADQFYIYTMANKRRRPVYAVEFKAPHKVTISELVAGLHKIDLARDIIN